MKRYLLNDKNVDTAIHNIELLLVNIKVFPMDITIFFFLIYYIYLKVNRGLSFWEVTKKKLLGLPRRKKKYGERNIIYSIRRKKGCIGLFSFYFYVYRNFRRKMIYYLNINLSWFITNKSMERIAKLK